MTPHSALRTPHFPSRSGFWLFIAILGSLVIHAGLWFWFQRTYLPYTTLPSAEKLILRKFKLARVEVNPKWIEPKLPPPEHFSSTPSPDRSSLTPTEEKRTFAKMLSQAPIPTSPTMPAGAPPIPQDKPIPSLGDLDQNSLNKSSKTALEEVLQTTQEKQSKNLLKSSGAGRPILNTPGAPVAPKPGSTELAPPTQAKVGPSQGPNPGEKSIFTGSSKLDDFFGVGGLPSPPPPPPTSSPKPPDPATLVPQSLPKEKTPTTQKHESLNPFLKVELFNYERKEADEKAEGYFLIRISAKPQQHLPVIPKDVYFVLDVSSSIGRKRLDSFTSTVLSAIPKLNPQDRFKILAFRDKLLAFDLNWSPAQNPPMEEVKKWLEKLKSSGLTDLYDSLRPITEHLQEAGRMAMALVLSDGVPTKGIVDSTQIINELSKVNDNKTSVFTLSTGENANNFLLDLLSYCNQGRLRYSQNIASSTEEFSQLVEQIKNPLFLNLRFRFAGINGDQVYPQNLPNLYEDSPLLLFGRYIPGQKTPISLQILGESFNSTKELLVQLPIPKIPNGPTNLPSTWALQRIYDLLSQMTRSPLRQESILNEVRQLSEEYKVDVPYF